MHLLKFEHKHQVKQKFNNLMHAAKWEKTTGHLLKDMKVLIIGYGRIGKTVTKILYAIGAKIFVYDPFLPDEDIPDFEFGFGTL